MNLEVVLTENKDQSIFSVSGEIDAYTAPRLKESFNPAAEQEGHEIIVDLEKVSYMDSTGLGVFIGVLKTAEENGNRLRIVNIQDRVLRLFHITGLDEIMDLKPKVREGDQ